MCCSHINLSLSHTCTWWELLSFPLRKVPSSNLGDSGIERNRTTGAGSTAPIGELAQWKQELSTKVDCRIYLLRNSQKIWGGLRNSTESGLWDSGGEAILTKAQGRETAENSGWNCFSHQWLKEAFQPQSLWMNLSENMEKLRKGNVGGEEMWGRQKEVKIKESACDRNL